jgi:cytochrome c oxidase cbb3-type subunit III
MYSRCAEIAVAVGVAILGGCEREQRDFSGRLVDPARYEYNAYAISEGKRLYEWFNCSGCHAHGGGAIGPALMDDKWVYGSDPARIYETIVAGRPNGMPAFRTVPDQQVWQLVAYVRSLGGQVRDDVAPGRKDSMHVAPSEQTSARQR